jgi:hypothetical protein
MEQVTNKGKATQSSLSKDRSSIIGLKESKILKLFSLQFNGLSWKEYVKSLILSDKKRISMIISRMISENDVCGSVLLLLDDQLLVSTNSQEYSEQNADLILLEMREFIIQHKLNPFSEETNKAKNLIIKRAFIRSSKARSLPIYDQLISEIDSNYPSEDIIDNNITLLKFFKSKNLDGVIFDDSYFERYFKLIIPMALKIYNLYEDEEENNSSLVNKNKYLELYGILFSDLYGAKSFIYAVENFEKELLWQPIINSIEEKKWIFPQLTTEDYDFKSCYAFFSGRNASQRIKKWCQDCIDKDSSSIDSKTCLKRKTELTLHTEQKKVEHFGKNKDDLKYFIESVVDKDTYFGISKNCCYPCHLKLTSIYEVFFNEDYHDGLDNCLNLGCSGVCFKSTRYPKASNEIAGKIQAKIAGKIEGKIEIFENEELREKIQETITQNIENIQDIKNIRGEDLEKLKVLMKNLECSGKAFSLANFPLNECFFYYISEIKEWVDSEAIYLIFDDYRSSNEIKQLTMIIEEASMI